MSKLKPAIMLVGEAAGYEGCRLTGIPFTSEEILIRGIPKFNLLGEKNGYKVKSESLKSQGERTATMMWDILEGLNFLPILWNVVPFHPYLDEEDYTNRKPSQSEIEMCMQLTLKLKSIFKIEQVIAVGKVAYESLSIANIECKKVRHPSFGGKARCRTELEALILKQKGSRNERHKSNRLSRCIKSFCGLWKSRFKILVLWH